MEEEILKCFLSLSGSHLGFYDKNKKEIKPSSRSKPLVIENENQIKSLLNEGWKPEEIIDIIRKSYTEYKIKASFIREIINKNSEYNLRDVNRQLIKKEDKYLHKQLNNRFPPKITINDDGTSSYTPGFPSSTKASYTLKDLINYYKSLTGDQTPEELLVNTFSYLLKLSELDTLLIAIDLFSEERDNNPMKIIDYLGEASSEVTKRRNH
jgi:hypothetical protein